MKNIIKELNEVQDILLEDSSNPKSQEAVVRLSKILIKLKEIYQEPVKVKTEPNLPERIFNGDLYAVIVKSESIGNRLKDLNTVKYGLSQLKRQLIEEDGERLDWQYKQMINELVGWETFREEVCNIRKTLMTEKEIEGNANEYRIKVLNRRDLHLEKIVLV